MRILQVVGGLNRGGVETWLVHVLRNVNRSKYQMDFLVHTSQPGAYDREVLNLGARIIPCLSPSNPLVYARNFWSVLREFGPYDCVHSHVQHFSGYVLMLAAMAGIPVRVVHSHLAQPQSSSNILRKAYCGLTRSLVSSFATKRLAVSTVAGDALFPNDWNSRGLWETQLLGIDLSPFDHEVNTQELRARLQIPENAVVIGHVGRFAEQKNHRFFVRVARSFTAIEPRAFFLLVGDGPLRSEIEALVTEAGLSDRFLFTGLRGDIPSLMKGAMDAMVFPSLYEGLPLTLAEAQAAGLPSVVSDTISTETDLLPDLIHRHDLNEGPDRWADELKMVLSELIKGPRQVTNSRLQTFSIEQSTKRLTGMYDHEQAASK